MPQSYLDGRVIVHAGDCMEILKTLPENSVDSIVCDPPYHLHSGNQSFDWSTMKPGSNKCNKGPTNKSGRNHNTGFMGKQWDGGDIAFRPELWAEVLRVSKPGGYICAFGGCRTYHRMACAIEDAGFITHPMIAWVFGQGFGKGKNLSKQIDLEAGVERQVVGAKITGRANAPRSEGRNYVDCASGQMVVDVTAPATDVAKQWDGWFYGTQSLKPALEPIYLGQKPFSEKTGAKNVLRWGTGALNIGVCRVGTENTTRPINNIRVHGGADGAYVGQVGLRPCDGRIGGSESGRWPANLLHDGSDEVLACFPETAADNGKPRDHRGEHHQVFNGAIRESVRDDMCVRHGDSGSAARFFASFPQTASESLRAQIHELGLGGSIPSLDSEAKRIFYTAKAGPDDRLGSKHPTIKPLKLLQYLCRLITPSGGTILDCFAGTGTTAEAAYREGFNAILIEREAEYLADIDRRMGLVKASKQERKQASAKARSKIEDAGPLFEAAE